MFLFNQTHYDELQEMLDCSVKNRTFELGQSFVSGDSSLTVNVQSRFRDATIIGVEIWVTNGPGLLPQLCFEIVGVASGNIVCKGKTDFHGRAWIPDLPAETEVRFDFSIDRERLLNLSETESAVDAANAAFLKCSFLRDDAGLDEDAFSQLQAACVEARSVGAVRRQNDVLSIDVDAVSLPHGLGRVICVDSNHMIVSTFLVAVPLTESGRRQQEQTIGCRLADTASALTWKLLPFCDETIDYFVPSLGEIDELHLPEGDVELRYHMPRVIRQVIARARSYFPDQVLQPSDEEIVIVDEEEEAHLEAFLDKLFPSSGAATD